jgi:hypothetical protein
VESAIREAKAAGQSAKAVRWALIGHPFPEPIPIPEGAAAVILEYGLKLPQEHENRLRERFPAEKGKVAFLSADGPYPAALYLLDRKGVVRAADPRPDSIEQRIRRLAGRD